MNWNKIQIAGNLTQDPELRFTPKGTPVVDIGLAVNRYFKGDNDEKKEEVTFIDVTLWGRQAEIVGEFCRKGKPVFIEGRLQFDTWDDKQTGAKRSKLKVVGESVQLIGGKDQAQSTQSSQGMNRAHQDFHGQG